MKKHRKAQALTLLLATSMLLSPMNIAAFAQESDSRIQSSLRSESVLVSSDPNMQHTPATGEEAGDLAGILTVTGDTTISGSSSKERILVREDATVTLDNVNIVLNDCNGSSLEIASGKTLTLKLKGSNTLKSFAEGPGILVNEDANLIIEDNGQQDGTLTVNGAKLRHFTSGEMAGGQVEGFAGIGSKNYSNNTSNKKNSATITIHSGTITAMGYGGGAGIGGGNNASGGRINIHGGRITATAKGDESSGWQGQNKASGIGGSQDSDGDTITITNGTVTAIGSNTCPGIGGKSASIDIKNATVHATGGASAAGIGGQKNSTKIDISIHSDANITALAGSGASAIGEGSTSAAQASLAIEKGAKVIAFSDGTKPAIKEGSNIAENPAPVLIATGKKGDLSDVTLHVDKVMNGQNTLTIPNGFDSFASTVPDVSTYAFSYPNSTNVLVLRTDKTNPLSSTAFVNNPVVKYDTALSSIVYLDGTIAKSGDGSSPDKAVKTIKEAVNLMQDGSKIHVTGTVTISDKQKWDAVGDAIEIIRNEGFKDDMFVLEKGADLTLTGAIIIDGGSFESDGSLFKINGGSLDFYSSSKNGKSPILQNNYNRGNGGAVMIETGGALYLEDKSTIQNNQARYGGGIYVNGGDLVVIDGDVIKNNAIMGSGVFVKSGTMKMIWETHITQNINSADIYLAKGCKIGISYLLKQTTPTVIAMESKIGPFAEGTKIEEARPDPAYTIKDTDKAFFTSEAGYTITLKDNNLVLEDTIAPTFTNDPRVETVTDSKATINFSSSEDAKVYWLIDPVTQPNASDIMTKGNSKDSTGEETSRLTLNDLEASKKHEVYMLLEDTSGNISDIEVLQFMTNQAAPTLTLKDLKVNYKTETFELSTEFEAYTNLDDPSGSMLTPEGIILSAIPGQTIYVRYKEKEVETATIPASAPVAITFPKRPIAPAKKELTVTVDSIKVNNLVLGEEYLLVKKGDPQNWDQVNQTGQFTGLEMNSEYTLYARKAYVEGNAFVSLASNVDIKTLSMNEVVSMVEGTNQNIYYGDDAVFKSSAAFEDFIQVVIDDQILDKDNYTKQNGSTIITLKAEYLKTLSMGEHTISIQSTSGNAIAQFKMVAKEIPGIKPDQPNTTPEQPNTNLDQPNTGDTTNIVLMSLLVLLSFIIIVFLWKKKLQKEQE